MLDKTTVAISKRCLKELKEIRFDLRVETLEEAIEQLIKEHREYVIEQ